MWSRISHTGDTFPGVSCGLFCGSCYRKDARMAAKCPNPAGNSNCRGQATVLSSLQLTSSAQDTVLVTVAQHNRSISNTILHSLIGFIDESSEFLGS